MSTLSRQESPTKPHFPSLRHRAILNVEDDTDMRADRQRPIATSLDSIHISPRVPSTTAHSGRRLSNGGEPDEVELSLLSQEHDQAYDNDVPFGEVHKKTKSLSVRDRKAMTLLIILCPSIPFHHPLLALTLLRPYSRSPGEYGTSLARSHANVAIHS